jgi:hypothetical protein
LALDDHEMALAARIRRTSNFWLDPSFEPSPSFVAELQAAAADFPVSKLGRQGGYTREDRFFEDLEPVLARCSPELLTTLIRRKLQDFAARPPEARYWSAIQSTDHLILAGESEAAAMQALRLSSAEADERHEAIAAGHLLLVEIGDLKTEDQF